jgi:hypothetical protein
MLSRQNCKSKHYDIEKWGKYHDTRSEHQHCHIFVFDLIAFFWFFLFAFFIDTSMAVAEEHSSLFNKDN